MPPLAALPIAHTPVAVLDFETTGLRPGGDRVVEVAIVRLDPGREPRLVLETLVNPRRRMACTEIHGITDADVADAPEFAEIVPALLAALGGCAMAAYNVYFDLKFLEYELDRAGHSKSLPHFCLMYLRPMLGLGGRCSLDDACREHGIVQTASHLAAEDVYAEAKLYRFYQSIFTDRGLHTFGDLAQLRDYKFCASFDWEPPVFSVTDTPCRLKSRQRAPAPAFPPLGQEASGTVLQHERDAPVTESTTTTRLKPLPHWPGTAAPRVSAAVPPGQTPRQQVSDPGCEMPPRRYALRQYWESLKLVLSDLDITDGELEYIERKKRDLGLTDEEIRLQHARAFASIITQFADDQRLDDRECRKLNRMHRALARLGWAPGQ